VNQLLIWPKFLSLQPFLDGRLIISHAVVSHPEGELRVEVVWISFEDLLELSDRGFVFALAESEHRVVVLLLGSCHNL